MGFQPGGNFTVGVTIACFFVVFVRPDFLTAGFAAVFRLRVAGGFDLASAALVEWVCRFLTAGFSPCLEVAFVLETGLTAFAWDGLLGVGLALPARRDLRILIWGGAGLAETDLANFERLRLAAGAFCRLPLRE